MLSTSLKHITLYIDPVLAVVMKSKWNGTEEATNSRIPSCAVTPTVIKSDKRINLI